MAQKVKNDSILFMTVLFLVAGGLLMLYSASSVVAQARHGWSGYFAVRQLVWAVVAVLVMMFLKKIDYRLLNTPKWAFPSISVVLVLLILVYFLDARAHRWFRLGPASFQPSELAKPVLILFLAYFAARRATAINNKYTLMPAAMIVGLVAGAVMVADIGTAVVLTATAAAVFLCRGSALALRCRGRRYPVPFPRSRHLLQALPHRPDLRLYRFPVRVAGQPRGPPFRS